MQLLFLQLHILDFGWQTEMNGVFTMSSEFKLGVMKISDLNQGSDRSTLFHFSLQKKQ